MSGVANPEKALTDLAAAAGLLATWTDAAGDRMVVSADSLRTILAAMQLPAGTDAEIADSRTRLAQDRAASSDFITADALSRVDIPGAGGLTEARLIMEDGEARTVALAATPNGLSFIAPETPGYHRLEFAGRQVTVAVAPPRALTVEDAAPGRTLWGTTVQVYSLRGERAEPFGDFGALATFAAAAGRRGASALAISPVHALFLADERRYSPYAPSTRLFLNGLYADPAAMFGATDDGGEAGGDLIDWATAIPAKRDRLRKAHDAFQTEADGPRRADFNAFCKAGGADLHQHAVFEALHDRFFTESEARGWQDWPEAFHDPDRPAVIAFAAANADAVDFHLFLQWLADRSLAAAQSAAKDAGMAVGLIADLAVGMDAGGSHAWSRRADILNGLSVGAPPDLFQPTGQDWGIAAFSPQALKRSGYTAFLATLRAAMRHAGGMRIDHAMGLRRLWMVPQGGLSKDGAYLTYPFEDMLRLIKLESHRACAIVVGEDLGTVPEGFRETTGEAGVMGMRVLWFEREDGGFTSPDRWSKDAMAMTSTHDLPTVAGWWKGRDIDLAVELGDMNEAERRAGREADRTALWTAFTDAGVATSVEPPAHSPEAVVDGAALFTAATPCELALIPVEDLLGLVEQVNLPGVVDGHPNWRRRLPDTPDALLDQPAVKARIDRLNRSRPA